MWGPLFIDNYLMRTDEISSAKTPLSEAKAKVFLSLRSAQARRVKGNAVTFHYLATPIHERPPTGVFCLLRGQIELTSQFGKNTAKRSEGKGVFELALCASPKGKMEQSDILQSGYPDIKRGPLRVSFYILGPNRTDEVSSTKTPLSKAKAKVFLRLRVRKPEG